MAYPVGHRRRRGEGIPLLLEKFERSLAAGFDAERAKTIIAACRNHGRLAGTAVDDFISLWIK